MLEFLLSKIGLVLIFGIAGFAWWKGGPGERAGATAVIVAWIVALAVQGMTRDFNQMLMLTVVDGLLALAMLVIAVSYSSLWLGVAMVLQGAVLAVHSIALGGGLTLRQYYIDLNVASSAMLWAMLFATIASWRGRSKRASRRAEPTGRAMANPV
jgi:hypothetical protein